MQSRIFKSATKQKTVFQRIKMEYADRVSLSLGIDFSLVFTFFAFFSKIYIEYSNIPIDEKALRVDFKRD